MMKCSTAKDEKIGMVPLSAVVPLNKQLAQGLADHSERLLTKPEMAALVHKKERTIDRWRARGRLPHLKIGHVVLFPEREVLEYLKSKFGRNLK